MQTTFRVNSLTHHFLTKRFLDSTSPLATCIVVCVLLFFALPTLGNTIAEIESLKSIAKLPSEFDRSAAVYSLLTNADEEELSAYMLQTYEISGKNVRESMQTIIIQRFATLNPKSALAEIDKLPKNSRHNLITQVFAEWSQHELDEAISHGQAFEQNKRLSALRGILRARDELFENRKQEITKAMGFEGHSPKLIAWSSIYSLIESPEEAWKTILNGVQPDVSQVGHLIQIAQAWIEKDGLSALDQIHSSMSSWDVRVSVLWPVLNSATDNDPEATLEYALSLDDEESRVYFVSNVIQRWAASDPRAALSAVSNLDSKGPLPQLEYYAISSWADQNPRELLNSMTQVPKDWQLYGKQQAISSIAQSTPEEAFGYLKQLPTSESRRNTALSITTIWTEQDPHAALDWIQTDPDIDNFRQDLISIVLSRLIKDDLPGAMQTALGYPVEQHRYGLEADIVREVANQDPEQALELLGQVREGHTKLAAFRSVGASLIQHGDMEQAREIGNQLSESDQEHYYASIVISWFKKDPESLVDAISSFPTEEIRSRTARTIISFNERDHSLSEEQVDSIRDFLTEEDSLDLSN